jgi:hypothetical protein
MKKQRPAIYKCPCSPASALRSDGDSPLRPQSAIRSAHRTQQQEASHLRVVEVGFVNADVCSVAYSMIEPLKLTLT